MMSAPMNTQPEAIDTPENNADAYRLMANAIRVLSMDAVQKANSGHPGMPMGMADVATVLFKDFLKFNAKDADWADRDRFILSAGHGSMLLYSLLYLTGYDDMTLDELKNFRQLGAKTAGHPEYGHAKGIETTTGPLGQGLANAVGFALAERMQAERFGDEVVNHFTYVIAGDGCLMEGISQEAISFAGHLGLSKLIVLFDDNHISIDGPTSLSTSEDHQKRFEACGWHVQAVDGHDADAVRAAIGVAQAANQPSMIACDTTIAFGAPTKAGTSGSHGAPLGDEEIAGTRANLGWQEAPFEIPAEVLQMWRDVGAKGAALQADWQTRLDALDAEVKGEFERQQSGSLPQNFAEAVNAIKADFVKDQPKWATRKSSGEVLERLVQAVPELIGGSADLTGSNNTKASCMKPISAADFSGNYIYYGIREHGMAAIMNGMALHGGVISYGGTFLVFTDYCRPSIRLSALMGKRVIYVMTHDSIGLGEDGPTHQPVEHLAALRAIPNLVVLRPADAVETLESWQVALENEKGPAVLVLSRQGLPAIRTEASDANLTSKGAYIVADADNDHKVTIMATGSEVEVALETKAALEAKNVGVRVVSVVSTELFEAQGDAYKKEVIGENVLRVAIEAAIRQGWERFIGDDGLFFGMAGFGASAPAGDLYKHFGLTADAIAPQIEERL